MNNLARMLGEALGEACPPRGDIPQPAVPVTPEALAALAKAYNESHTFKPGDIVQWKDGLKNRRSVGPFVVVDVLESPVFDSSEESSSPYYREPLDIRLGIVNSEDTFLIHHYDSHRLQPVTK